MKNEQDFYFRRPSFLWVTLSNLNQYWLFDQLFEFHVLELETTNYLQQNL